MSDKDRTASGFRIFAQRKRPKGEIIVRDDWGSGG